MKTVTVTMTLPVMEAFETIEAITREADHHEESANLIARMLRTEAMGFKGRLAEAGYRDRKEAESRLAHHKRQFANFRRFVDAAEPAPGSESSQPKEVGIALAGYRT